MECFADPAEASRLFLRRGLFVIGGPRNGTTVLQDALNDCEDIFLFGEPDFHADPGTPDFAHRYNAMHRAWSNQATKSTYCPKLFEADAPWSAYIERLAQTYKLVGAKMVLNPSTFLHDPYGILNFYARNFYNSHFIFTFRHPLQVCRSTEDFQAMTDGDPTPFDMIMASYVTTISLCIHMLRNFPRVQVAFHDNMTRQTLARLGRWLGVRLSKAPSYYDRKNVRTYDVAPLLHAHGEKAQAVLDLYSDFRQSAIKGFDRVQLAQNSANPSPTHLTGLGRLARRCELVSESFAPFAKIIA